MSEYKDSPKPLREIDPNPLFKVSDDGYVTKASTPMERQRRADGTGYSMNRPSSVEPKDYDLYIKGDKVTKSIEGQEQANPDDVIKAYMEKGDLIGEKIRAEQDGEIEEGIDAKKGSLSTAANTAVGGAKKLLNTAMAAKSLDKDDDDGDEIEKNKPKLGSGARFKKLSAEVAKEGASDPDAVAAAIGRKKYGAKKFAKLSAKGK